MWYNMEEVVDSGRLDIGIAKGLQWACRCGWAIVENNVGTKRRCSNPICPYHLSRRADALSDRFTYKDIGPVFMLKTIKENKLTSHFDVLNPVLYWGKEGVKDRLMYSYVIRDRRVYLHEIVQLAFIPGIQGRAEDIFLGYSSFVDYFKVFPRSFSAYQEILYRAEKYFSVIQTQAVNKLEVRITGSINLFPNREHFINHLNSLYGDRVFISYANSWKASIDVLISEDKLSMTTKAVNARSAGVPIVTSGEFLILLAHNYGAPKPIY